MIEGDDEDESVGWEVFRYLKEGGSEDELVRCEELWYLTVGGGEYESEEWGI